MAKLTIKETSNGRFAVRSSGGKLIGIFNSRTLAKKRVAASYKKAIEARNSE